MATIVRTKDRLWTGPHGRVVAGIFSLAFLIAFESLAVATVMPAVADDLGGLGLYAISFAAPIAVGIVSMALAGPSIDRRGPGPAMRGGVGLFAVGVVIAGVATSMPVFLVGRSIQGLGSGFVTVGLYVVIGRTFADDLRARVFTVMTSAWVLPALVGPVIAGTVAELVGWRWVFLGVPAIALLALALVWTALGQIDGDPLVPVDRRRALVATLVAAGILGVGVAGQRTVAWWPVLLLGTLAVVVALVPRVVPAGTWRWRPGLPGVVATRSLLGAGFFAAETYVPLSLVEHRGLTTAHAGLLLTSAAVSWFGGSWLAANVDALASKPLRVRLGAVCVLVGTTAGLLTLVEAIPVVVVAIVWSIGGLGMGLGASTLSVLLLDLSAPAEQGSNSAGMQTNDAVTQSLVLAAGSAVFAATIAVDEKLAFVLVFVLASVVGAGAVAMSARLR